LGIFARDATTFSRIGTQLLPQTFQPLVPRSARKYKLLYPVRSLQQRATNPYRWFPNPQEDPSHLTEAEKQLETFVRELEHSLACSRTPFNLDELWRAIKPRGQPSSLDRATGHIYSALVSYSAIHSGGINTFITDYTSSHAGAAPQISPIVKQRHDYGRSLQPPEIAKHLDSMQVFATWVENVLFGPADEEAITLLIFPQCFGVPNYRDEWSEDFVAYEKFSVYSFGYLVGCPDYTVPVGEVPFVSKVTGKTEYLPVSLSLVARRGKDVPLFDVLTMLEERGVLRGVRTGSRMY
jgi:Asp-tRNA(Asn)/Glu-tRNA(Gln) amidotransferase A subunit family amidase